MLTYAIGDIHGCHDLLQDLLEKIRLHAGRGDHRLVFLGDYIDRGPESAAVVETVRAIEAAAPDRVVTLKGNHEAMLLRAAADPDAVYWWLRNGGDATLESYGADDPRALPADVLGWLGARPTFYEDDRRYYVHAGLRPGVPLARQTDDDRIWIRDPFLEVDYDFGKHVVHGHTPVRSAHPDIRPFRTNLDTGAVYGGALSAGVFDDTQEAPVGIITVAAHPWLDM